MIERGGNIIAKKQIQFKPKDLKQIAKNHINFKNTILVTDDYKCDVPFKVLLKRKAVNHSKKQYVNGDIHTNRIEAFWSLLKRGITGQYHHLSDKWLNKHITEFCFKYDNRNNNNVFSQFTN